MEREKSFVPRLHFFLKHKMNLVNFQKIQFENDKLLFYAKNLDRKRNSIEAKRSTSLFKEFY